MQTIIHDLYFFYVVRTSSLNDKHSCQLFRMGLRDKIHTHIDHTFNQGQHELCCSYYLLQFCFSFFVSLHGQTELFDSYHLLQSCFSFFIHLHGQHKHGQHKQFGSCTISSLALLFSFFSMANLSCLLATTVLVYSPTHFHHLASIF